ncbi:hypothetical protein WR25_03866 isoform E [Diploscapter pachys]|nr:hypothetical protein WR25_03866 isoform B [Diploscapter pachys]PAV62966.1 hypothetical protein WR25_03866 isoform C [Diploscapter pachys]PAV62967.1 hypothetical protein WR25_03866 isoform D [Diploscapter pachys]PAV62968.1 hypothetical protein WR25_03866 isoform E [Diploscapter pachys]
MDPLALVNHYTTLESHLNDRRRIMYTNTPMVHLFNNPNNRCECPYEKEHLRPFDYKKFVGYNRNDLSSVYDYVRNFPDFHLLTTSEKNHVFRTTCCIDGMMDSAFYSIRIGYEDKRLITWNGSYITMSPMPMSGEEPHASIHFDSPEDHIKYRSLMPTKIQQWFNLVIPFHDLAPTFEEFSLIKALTVWHMSTFTFDNSNRVILLLRLLQTERCKPPDLQTTKKCNSERNPRVVCVEQERQGTARGCRAVGATHSLYDVYRCPSARSGRELLRHHILRPVQLRSCNAGNHWISNCYRSLTGKFLC